MKHKKLSDTFDGFERTVRAFSFSDNSGVSNSKQCDMSNGVIIFNQKISKDIVSLDFFII